MTDKTGTRKRESFSSLEAVSVVAITMILVMIAVPFPYANRNHASPALHTAAGEESVAADSWGGDTLKNAGEGTASSVGSASERLSYPVITVGKREFCADMPGVVRFRTTGASCRNGTTINSAQRHHDLQEKP